MRMSKLRVLQRRIWLFTFLSFFLILPPAYAEKGDWTFSLTTGVYSPSLKTLNRIIKNPNKAILQDPNFQLTPNTAFTANIRNIEIPSFAANNTYGYELSKQTGSGNAFVITLGIWNAVQEADDIAPQITGANVSDFENVPRSTRYDVSLTQLWLGWRYAFFEPTPRNNLFLDFGLIGVSYAQLTIDTLLKVPELAGDGFPIVSSLEATGWGHTTRWGIGGSYAINKWVGISIRAAYVIGRISKLKVQRFFPSGFSTPPQPANPNLPSPEVPDLEPRPEPGDTIQFADTQSLDPNLERRSNVQDFELELDGFEAQIALQFFF